MQVINRSQHFTDLIPDITKPHKRKRLVKNWCNFKDHLNNWSESIPALATQNAAPPEFSGVYDFDRASLNAPMQFFARDAMDAGNRAMVGIRLSDSPSKWLNIKADNIDNAVDVTEINNKTVQWTGLWTDTNYRVQHINNKIKVDFVLTGENHPTSFQETIKLAPSLSLVDNGDNSLSVMDGEEEVFKMPAPYGYAESDVLLENPIRVTMTKGAKKGVFETIIVTPNAEDLANIGYAENIIIDPTATISGSTDIEDNLLYSVNPGHNFGAYASPGFQPGIITASAKRRIIMRVASSAIPDGNISEVRFILQRRPYAPANRTDTLYAYQISSANTDWVEGTVIGASQIGSSCWLDHTFDNIQEWAGSVGLGTSGTDYNATAIGSQFYALYPSGPIIDFTVTFSNTQIWEDWRDGVTTNAGIFWRTGEVVHNNLMWGDMADGPFPLYFEIDYAEATSVTIQKSLTYEINVPVPTAIQKGLIYKVVTETLLQKSLTYAIKTTIKKDITVLTSLSDKNILSTKQRPLQITTINKDKNVL